jgi:integrase
VAVAGGASLPIIGALLGHTDAATTQRYAHLSNDPVRAVSDRAGQVIDVALRNGAADTKIRLVR